MKQILQSLKTGNTEVTDVPQPAIKRGHVLIRTSRTLVSAGTERMLVEFGKANWLEKARQQPDKVRMVLDKIKVDGLMPTVEAVFNKLDQPLPLGYCNVGRVIEVGAGVEGFSVGDRVASNGKHAGVVCVPVNLCARVPDGVTDEAAAFTVLGAVALQGIRLVQPTLGETVVVTGLGLIGLVTVQLLRAQSCRVLGLDFDSEKLALAKAMGAEVVNLAAGEDPIAVAQRYSRGRGVDAVIITASTRSSEPVHQAALMSRKRGRIVLVGVTGLELSRADFFEKELTFQVSCSYGPGRYDPSYEERGVDYPAGFVRWTEQRNFEAVLDMLDSGALSVDPLISHRIAIDDAAKAYALVGGSAPSLGIVLQYPQDEAKGESRSAATDDVRTVRLTPFVAASSNVANAANASVCGFIGAGNYATAVLVPAFKAAGALLHTVSSSGGVSGLHVARKFGFGAATTDSVGLIASPEINTVVVTTRHDSHADWVCRALAAGKHVFVEKPLALDHEQLSRVSKAVALRPYRVLMVGFNRRFAPHTIKMKALLTAVSGPKVAVMTVNAGAIPAEHWTQDAEVGGGRIVGEACHFIDLLRFLIGVPVVSWTVVSMDAVTRDSATIQLSFSDGSIATIHYLANGSKAFPKERVEVFAAGRVLQLDNFRKLTAWGWPGFKKMNLWRQDKGQKGCARAFVKAVGEGGAAPIPLAELMEVSRLAIDIAAACREGAK